MNLTKLIDSLMASLKLATDLGFIKTHDAAERALLVPKAERLRIMEKAGITGEQNIQTGHALFQNLADALSDLLLWLVSKGAMPAD